MKSFKGLNRKKLISLLIITTSFIAVHIIQAASKKSK